MKLHLVKIFVSILIGLALLSSCKKEEEGCTDSLSENYNPDAKVNDGSCTYARDKFISTYNVNMTCVYEGDSTYSMQITQGPNADEIILENFSYDIMKVNILAKVDGNNISFKDEKLGIVFEGSGYIVGETVTIDLEICEKIYYPCSDPESCTLTVTRQ